MAVAPASRIPPAFPWGSTELTSLDKQALADGAPVALACARRFCPDRCRDYHGIWLYARLLEVLPSVAFDHDFLESALKEAVEAGARRVLISGAAEFGLLSYVLHAFSRVGVEPEIMVIDLCRTPLEMCLWYARRLGIEIETQVADVLDYDAPPFDMITSHSFMNGFPAAERLNVSRRWRDLLRPGGTVVTANVITMTDQERVRRFDDAGTENLVRRMLAAHAGSALAQTITASELEDLARGSAGPG